MDQGPFGNTANDMPSDMQGTENERDHHEPGDGRGRETDQELGTRLRDLKGRLGKAEKARKKGATPDTQRANSIGLAFRLATELVAGLLVGGVIGWYLDKWLGTSPVMLLIFFALGAAAGIFNVIRTAREMQVSPTGHDLNDSDQDDDDFGDDDRNYS